MGRRRLRRVRPWRGIGPEVLGARDDALTVVAIGVMAASLAAVVHEGLGHPLGCIAVSGRVRLVTSIYFRCAGAKPFTDVAGPLGGLVGGLAALAALRFTPVTGRMRLFLFALASIDLLWFSGQLAEQAALVKDDWAFLARDLQWPTPVRLGLAAVGALIYVATLRLLAPTAGQIRRGTIPLMYAAAVMSACVAGLAWAPERMGGFKEGLMAVGVAPLGLLLPRSAADRDVGPSIARSWTWIAIAASGYVVFLAILGRGLGPLAGVGLTR
jgi:hypothetical protein